MSDPNVEFCKLMLSALVEEFRQDFPHIGTKRDAWTINAGFHDHWEFHGTGPAKDFYWHGHADNAIEARYKGWMAWAEQQKARIAMEYQSPPRGCFHIELVKGWRLKRNMDNFKLQKPVHAIVERTRLQARRRLADVVPCDCAECKAK